MVARRYANDRQKEVIRSGDRDTGNRSGKEILFTATLVLMGFPDQTLLKMRSSTCGQLSLSLSVRGNL